QLRAVERECDVERLGDRLLLWLGADPDAALAGVPGGQDRDDGVDSADVLERVEGEFEAFAAEQQQAVRRSLPGADRAVLAADATEVVENRAARGQRHQRAG